LARILEQMSTLLRVVVLVQAGVIAYFGYFLIALWFNDQYFAAWVQAQGLTPFFYFAPLGMFTLISVALSVGVWNGGKGVFAGSTIDGVKAQAQVVESKAAPTQQTTSKATNAPGPLIGTLAGPGDTTVIIPKESPLNAWVQERGEQYTLVDNTRKTTRDLPKLPASVNNESDRKNTDDRRT
jgi:hypothetical protein